MTESGGWTLGVRFLLGCAHFRSVVCTTAKLTQTYRNKLRGL
jgi:hypothetical protein